MAREISGSSLGAAASGNRIAISFFGKRNAGKSSLINAVTGQQIAIVSDVEGTTTDPVSKAMELLPLGPVLITDTPGMDDTGTLGELRVKQAEKVLRKTHIALLLVDGSRGLCNEDTAILEKVRDRKIPFLVVINKADMVSEDEMLDIMREVNLLGFDALPVSVRDKSSVEKLKKAIIEIGKSLEPEKILIRDLIPENSVIILVTPIDEAAPKGRIILPQVQTIRDLLDGHAVTMILQPEQLRAGLDSLKEEPYGVITDSQVFHQVDQILGPDFGGYLTSFSILFARFKGVLAPTAEGALSLRELEDGDKVLISEGCTHHRQCDDIGTRKLPDWIRSYSGAEPEFHFTSGGEFPDDLTGFKAVVHCGGCMLNEKEMEYRMRKTLDQGVKFTNYGITIACINGILEKAMKIMK